MEQFLRSYLELEARRESDLAANLAGLVESLALAHPVHALPVTFLSAIRKEYDENTVSDFLAFVLDPHRSGLGRQAICALLDHFGYDHTQLSFADCEVTREFPFSNGGRIDILIQIDHSFVIAIENKVLSKEGIGQTVSYAASINMLFPNCDRLMIFLAPGNQAPSSPCFKMMNYTELHSILGSLPSNDVEGSTYLISDFILHIKEYISMDRPLPSLSQKTQLYLEHFDAINDVTGAFKEDSERMYEYLTSKIRASYEGPDWAHEKFANYQLVYKKPWHSNELRVFFVFRLSRELLLKDELTVTLEVQGYPSEWNTSPHINPFIARFSEMFPEAMRECKARNMKIQPLDTPTALALKSFPYELAPVAMEQALMQAIDEFEFLIDPLDRISKKS